LISNYNKREKGGIQKKKPVVWRKEAVWGIEPEFIHDRNSKKLNYKEAAHLHVKSIHDE